MTVHEVLFDPRSSGPEWIVVNDDVMGGVSRSRMTIGGDGPAVFEGYLSLDHGGGFASTRTRPTEFDLEGWDGLLAEIRGDGRRYRLRLRSDDAGDGVAYQMEFATRAGEWRTIRAPFGEFHPVRRGRPVPGAPPLSPSRIRQIGFLIADRREGGFRLEIRTLSKYRNEEHGG
jgi:monofunctional biosynthetic peptidoglycan transglycosylase